MKNPAIPVIPGPHVIARISAERARAQYESANTQQRMTVPEVAAYLGITQAAVRWTMHEGNLEAIKLGRHYLISRESVERYANRAQRVGRKPKPKLGNS